MTIDRKDRLYLLGFLGVLIKGFVMEPFSKASVTWTPPVWLLTSMAWFTVVAVVVVVVLIVLGMFKKNQS